MKFISDEPILLKSWDFEKNKESINEVLVNTEKTFSWKSQYCAHRWNAKPKEMLKYRNSSCLVCLNYFVVVGFNDIKTIHPDIFQYLDPSNQINIMTPLKSKEKFLWICKNNHSFPKSIESFIKNKLCVYCHGRKLLKGFNDLATKNPKVLKEWDYSKNIKNPSSYHYQSTVKVWWKCIKCSYSWEMKIYLRTSSEIGCIKCSPKVKIADSLLSQFPEISKDWNYELNELKPSEVKPYSHNRVWWNCSENIHKPYSQLISKRTGRGTGCPECSKGRGSSKGEFEVGQLLENMGLNFIQNSRKIIPPMELDFYIPSLNIGVEYNGEWMHSNQALKPDSKDSSFRDYHLRKKRLANSEGIDLLFVWEHDWFEHRDIVKEALIVFFKTGEISKILSRLESYKDVDKDCCFLRV